MDPTQAPPAPPQPGDDAVRRAMALSVMPEKERWLMQRLGLGQQMFGNEPHRVHSGAGGAAAWGLADAVKQIVGAHMMKTGQQGLFDLSGEKLKARQEFYDNMSKELDKAQQEQQGTPELLKRPGIDEENAQNRLQGLRRFSTAAAMSGDPVLQAGGEAHMKELQMEREMQALQGQLAFHREQISQHQRALDQKDRQLTEMEKYHNSRLKIQEASSVGLRKELFDEKEINKLGQGDQKTSAALAAHDAAKRLIDNLEKNHGNLPGVGRVQGHLPNIISPNEWQANQADAVELVKSALLAKGGAITPDAVDLQMKALGLSPGSDIETFKKGISTALEEVASKLGQHQSSVKPANLETYHQRGGITAADVRATGQRLRDLGKKNLGAPGGDPYAKFRSDLQPGEKLVLNPDGKPEALAPGEKMPPGYSEAK